MGACWCKEKSNEEVEMYGSRLLVQPPPASPSENRLQTTSNKAIDIKIIDQLILEMLSLIASFVDNDEESPLPLVRLHMIAENEDSWTLVVSSMIHVIPLEDPFGPSAITILLDDCPLPSKESVVKVTQLFGLSERRALSAVLNERTECNICIFLGCIADKLAGPHSVAILSKDILEYLITFLYKRRTAAITLFALLALEKFAQTTENKLTIKKRLECAEKNPLLVLESMAKSDDYVWRQVGFCANWALDNTFVHEDRKLSYEQVDMSEINVILNTNDVSEYLKISSYGLEARCDSYSFESVRCTFQVDEGCWYFEATVVTPGVMQIGWATKNSHFLNHDGYGIGDDLYSISYDGCRRLIWYKAKSSPVRGVPAWKPGDVLGCLLDINSKDVIFSLNGQMLPSCKAIFDTTRTGFFAAASFMAFQQCIFNFGHEPFKYIPDRAVSSFNQHGHLTEEEKKVIPRRVTQMRLQSADIDENCCTLCCDEISSCVLEPCRHSGFCSVCVAQLKECPMCRSVIVNVRQKAT